MTGRPVTRIQANRVVVRVIGHQDGYTFEILAQKCDEGATNVLVEVLLARSVNLYATQNAANLDGCTVARQFAVSEFSLLGGVDLQVETDPVEQPVGGQGTRPESGLNADVVSDALTEVIEPAPEEGP